MKKLLAIVTLMAALAACGGSERPTTDDVAKALKDKDNSVGQTFTSAFEGADDATLECIAKVLYDSDISNDALQAIVDGDADYKGSSKDADAVQEASTNMAKCIIG